MFWILSRHVSSAKWKDCENFMEFWRSLIYIKKRRAPRTDPWGTPYQKLCISVLSVREVGRKRTIGYISYTMLWKFMKQYVMIYSIKCFLQINKDSTNKHFIIYCLFNIFNKANYCRCSSRFLWNPNCFLYRTFWSFKNPINLLSISFSVISSRLDNRVIGL